MKGLSSASKQRIYEFVDELFDNMSLQLLGEIPSLRNKKSILFSSRPDFTLANLFLKSLGTNNLNPAEEEALKNIVSGAEQYVSSLRSKTKGDLLNKIESYVREKNLKGQAVSTVDIRSHVKETFEKAKSHFNKIAEYETTQARNLGNTFQIAKVAQSQGISDPNVFFIVIKDNSLCPDCVRMHLMPDGITPKVWKLSDVGFGYGKKSDTKPTLVRHPHCRCLWDKHAPVVTERGIVPISKVKINDRVLTHTGKFKKVLATFGEDGVDSDEDVYRIEYFDPEGKLRKLRTTSDHLMMTETGWVRTDSLDTKIHKLMWLYKECEECKISMPYKINKPNQRFCGSKCVHENKRKNNGYSNCLGLKQSSELIKKRVESIKKSVDLKTQISGKRGVETKTCLECLCDFEYKKAYKDRTGRWIYKKGSNFCSQTCRSKSITKRQWSCEKHRENVSAKNKKSMEQQYASGIRDSDIVSEARKALLERKGPTKDHGKIYGIVKQNYSDAVIEYKIGKFWADIAIPSLKTVIEWDGEGHWMDVFSGKLTKQEKIEKDRRRDEFMNSEGWHVLRYSPESGYSNVLEDIRRVSLNSTSGYSFAPVSIKQIVKIKKESKSKKSRLYDITVEDDSSFVVMGVISHNCSLSFLSPGFSFVNGQVTFVGQGHDEYKKQRGES